VIRPTLAALFACLLVAGCSAHRSQADASDPYAGLAPEILAWRTDLQASHPACRKAGKCGEFEVTCKGAQDITPQERASGVTARLVAAMTFRASDAAGGQPGSAFATFSKSAAGWTRAPSPPVNLSSCAPV